MFSSCSLLVPKTLSLNGSASSSCSPTSSVIFSSPPEFEFTLDNDPESEMSEQFEFYKGKIQLKFVIQFPYPKSLPSSLPAP